MSAYVKLRSAVVLALLSSALSFPAHAQYTGPSEIGQTTVAEILKNPVDDQDVRVQGHLLRQTAHDKFLFSDGSGEIVAEIKAKHFAGQTLDEKTRVELIGEVDTSSKRPPEIEVDFLKVVD
ncbi:NirD/YgiW/YdeI family stress tolerance protein [Alcaligenes sp. A-TC2]|uniref:YgiW/YdeI family stress tolerance OB fold protein n=1 Tax=Alcaligenes nematophilus TaxID=2994643 RepID=UPI002252A706|nr:NirD/YgiW/YdeI family stress tolerance protein [Alcaligenes nematophilus]MCX5472691.1 NirD/YgiW/YdeI family stress tolerance protein [Alcaligenes nematophilus]